MSARSKGFTLIELLIVIAIIGITVSVATPSWMNMRRRNGYDGAKKKWVER